ncbi:hypothetical protein ACHAWF_005264 [Thalassiosira exigua]
MTDTIISPETKAEGDNTDGTGTNKHKSISTVWHGYDVVLTENSHPSEISRDNHEAGAGDPQSDRPDPHPQDKNCRVSWRRTSNGERDDYGWLRQLDLRSDVPDIDEIRSWSFDVLQFEDSVLIDVFIKMLEYYDLLEKFQLDRQVLERYSREVMEMHHKDCYYQRIDIERAGVDEEKPQILCEYHSWYHAVGCTHASFLFLTLGGADAYLEKVDVFCILMGALIHDLDHPGTNNDFEIKRSSSLAKLYDNDAVLERHSINMGLNMCLDKPELNWMKSFQTEDCDYVKHFIGESVLATDPARHAGIVKEALEFVDIGLQDYQSTPTPESPKHGEESQPSLAYFNRNSLSHRIFIGRLILHSADISNPVHSSFDVAADWAIRVTTEFSKQAQKEKQLELPVTTFMDGLDSQVKIAEVQIGFFKWMVKPLYHTIGLLFPALKMMEGWGEKHCDEYQVVIDEHEKKLKDSMSDEAQTNDNMLDQRQGRKDSTEEKIKNN